MNRRDFLACGAGLLLAGGAWPRAWAGTGSGSLQPTWLSFGLGGSALGGSRFPLTQKLSKAGLPGHRDFQLEVSRAIEAQLRQEGDLVLFRDEVDINEGTLLGAALDYENVLSARLGASSFLVLHLVGHGMLLNFDRSRGWKMHSSFPFPVTLLRVGQSGNAAAEASKYLFEAYTDPKNSFATAFAKAARRVAPQWHDRERSFNVRVMSSRIHPEVQSHLKEWKIADNINAAWLGHLASAAVCEGLGIPVVPFAETQALGKFTYKFSDRLVAQNIQLPDVADIDVRLSVTLRNIAREIKYRQQLDRWEVARIVIMDVQVLDDRDEEIVSLRMGYADDQPDVVASRDEVVPARDAHFFDMAVYRGLQSLFTAIDRQDDALLAKLFVKPDEAQKKGLERFRKQYRKAV